MHATHLESRTYIHPEEGGSKVLQGVGIPLHHFVTSQARRPQLAAGSTSPTILSQHA